MQGKEAYMDDFDFDALFGEAESKPQPKAKPKAEPKKPQPKKGEGKPKPTTPPNIPKSEPKPEYKPDFTLPWKERFKIEMELAKNDQRLSYFALGLATLFNDPSTGCAKAYSENKWTLQSIMEAFLEGFGKADFISLALQAKGNPDELIFGRIAHMIVDEKPKPKKNPEETPTAAKPQEKKPAPKPKPEPKAPEQTSIFDFLM